jgi:sugar/nucleoside kinase (ribokinase family)
MLSGRPAISTTIERVAGYRRALREAGAEVDDRLVPALRFANAVGAITTTRYGAIPALPTRAG